MYKAEKIYAIIPARSGSKGVKNKNIANIGGIPMIAHTIKSALSSNYIDRVIVSTDSKEYADISRSFGAEVPFLRPSNISKDFSTDIDFFLHLIKWLENNENYCPEYLVHLRPTTPIRDKKVIDSAIKNFIGSGYSALRSIHKMSHTSYKSFEIEDNKLKMINSNNFDIEKTTLPRQSFPSTYDANGYIDIVKKSNIVSGFIHGSKVMPFLTKKTYEVDEIEDLEYIKYLFKIGKNS